jgi:hypothetical protein
MVGAAAYVATVRAGQDQYNMNEKSMMPMEMRLLLTSLEAIERICTYEKGKSDSYKKSEKSSNKGEKGKKRPGTNFLVRVPKKVRFEKRCDLCKKHGGAYTMHNTLVIVIGLKRTERRNPISVLPRKADIKVIL